MGLSPYILCPQVLVNDSVTPLRLERHLKLSWEQRAATMWLNSALGDGIALTQGTPEIFTGV